MFGTLRNCEIKLARPAVPTKLILSSPLYEINVFGVSVGNGQDVVSLLSGHLFPG
jgi:hypothetical protein